jgi:hypothetical protein
MGTLVLRMLYSGKYDPVLGINMLLIGDSKIGVVGFRSESDMVNLVLLPGDLAVESSSGKGRYRIGSLWGVGKLENKPGEEVMMSLSKALGLRITGYIKVNDGEVSVSSLGGVLTNWRVKTNLNWWDRFRLLSLIKKLFDRGTLVEKSLSSSLFREEVEPDGVRVLVFDGEKIFSWGAREWVNPAILKERVSVAIFNNGGEQGRALVWGRMLETVGARVLEVDKAFTETNGCKYRLSRREVLEMVKMLEKDFGCREEEFESVLGPGRVDIEILTG